nr:MAG TPA: hypothetical protein [Caudoviricetes sp.]
MLTRKIGRYSRFSSIVASSIFLLKIKFSL